MDSFSTPMNRNFLFKKGSIFLLAGVFYFFGQYLRGEWFVNTKIDFLCHPYIENGKTYCHSIYLNQSFSLIAIGEIFAIIGIILLFANERGFRSWFFMSLWFVPLAALAIIFVTPLLILPINAHASYDGMVWLFGYIYIFITLILVSLRRFSRSNPA
jgi:hypothetical protein